MMEQRKIAVVMIGCGTFSHRYHVPALAADPDAPIAGIFDPTPSSATRRLAEDAGAVLTDTIDGLPDPDGPVAAIVTTPHTLHARHVREALERGWHTLCDKPFVPSAEEARALAQEAERRSLVNAVAYNRRFDRGCLEARSLLRTGAIGTVCYIETVQLGYERAGWFLDPALGGGGPYTGRASHMADLIPWLLERRPTRLRSRLRGDGGPRADRGGFINLLFDELECHLACIEEGWHGWDEVRIFGDEGLLELRRPLHLPIGWELRLANSGGKARSFLAAEPVPGQATADFLAAVRGQQSVACSFAAAIPSVSIVEQAFRSARTGEKWLPVEGDMAATERVAS